MNTRSAGQSGVLDSVYGTGREVRNTVDEIHKYSAEAQSGGIDPLNTLINKGLGFVINYIQPVKQALELVTGSPDALNGSAQNYTHISDDINKLGQDLHDEVKSGFAGWKGDASDAAHQQMAEFLDGVHGTAVLASYISEVLQASAALMQAAKDIIIGILADFVEQMLVTWAIGLAGTIVTLGASDAVAVAATEVEATFTVVKAGKAVSRVAKLIEKIGTVLKKIVEVIQKIAKILEKIGGKIEKTGGSIGKKASELLKEAGPLKKLTGKTLDSLADKAEGVGKKVSGLGHDLGSAAESVGKVGHDLSTHNRDGLGAHVKEAWDKTGKVIDDVRKFDEKAGHQHDGSHHPDRQGHHSNTRETLGDRAKEHLKAGWEDIKNNEREIHRQAEEAGALPTESSQEIDRKLSASPGAHRSETDDRPDPYESRPVY